MNYYALFNKGIRYVENAGNIWDKRKSRLITAWCNTENPFHKRRINSIIDVLETRLKTLTTLYYEVKRRAERQKWEADNSLVLLECPEFECSFGPNAVGVGVRFKDYEPGKHRCPTCGGTVRPKADMEADNLLYELGMRFNNVRS